MATNNFKHIQTQAEILSLIILTKGVGRGLFWQTGEENKVHKIEHIEVDCVRKMVNLQSGGGVDLLPSLPLNVKLNTGLVFKINPGTFIFSDDMVQFSCPSVGSAEVSGSINTEIILTLKHNLDQGGENFNVRLVSFTPAGLRVACKEEDSDAFYRSSFFHIEAVNGNSLVPSMATTMTQINESARGDIQIGLKVENERDINSFEFMNHAFR